MRNRSFMWGALLVAASACSSHGGGGGGGACERDLSGRWSISGSCPLSSCTVTQTGCAFSVRCNDGSQLNGSVSGVQFSGIANSSRSTSNCTGTLEGSSLDGSCSTATTRGTSVCTFRASCSDGPCGTPLERDAGTQDAGADAPPVEGDAGGAQVDWSTNAVKWRGQDGRSFTLRCPRDGAAGSVWGTDVYTDDSSVCTAAVHAGRIGLAAGGAVTIQVRPGGASYTGSARNGVTSRDYGAWGGSFVVR